MLEWSLSSTEDGLAVKNTKDGQSLGASGDPGGESTTALAGIWEVAATGMKEPDTGCDCMKAPDEELTGIRVPPERITA